jgi:surfactin synthase thioesterase subunit
MELSWFHGSTNGIGKIRLFSFTYATRNANVFNKWQEYLGRELDIIRI